MHSYDMMPYEVVKEYGAQELDDKELLAVFIRTGTREQNAVEVADRVLNSFPERNLLGALPYSVEGIDENSRNRRSESDQAEMSGGTCQANIQNGGEKRAEI